MYITISAPPSFECPNSLSTNTIGTCKHARMILGQAVNDSLHGLATQAPHISDP